MSLPGDLLLATGGAGRGSHRGEADRHLDDGRSRRERAGSWSLRYARTITLTVHQTNQCMSQRSLGVGAGSRGHRSTVAVVIVELGAPPPPGFVLGDCPLPVEAPGSRRASFHVGLRRGPRQGGPAAWTTLPADLDGSRGVAPLVAPEPVLKHRAAGVPEPRNRL